MKKRKVRGPAKATGYTMAVIMSPGRTHLPKKDKDTSRFHPAVNSSSKIASHINSRHDSSASSAYHNFPRSKPMVQRDTLTPLPKRTRTSNSSNLRTSISAPTRLNPDHYSNTHYYSGSTPSPHHSTPYFHKAQVSDPNGPHYPRVDTMGRRASYSYGMEMEHPQPMPIFSSPVSYQSNHRNIHHPKRSHSWSSFPTSPQTSTLGLSSHGHHDNEILDDRFRNINPHILDQHTPRASNHLDDPDLSFMYTSGQPQFHAIESHNQYQYGEQWDGEPIVQHNTYDGSTHTPQISAAGTVNLDAFTFPTNPSSNLSIGLPDHSNPTSFHPSPTPAYTYGYSISMDAPSRSGSMSSMSSATTSAELSSPTEDAILFNPQMHMLQGSGDHYAADSALLPPAFEDVESGFDNSQPNMISMNVLEKQHNLDEEMMDTQPNIIVEEISEDRGYTDPEQYVLKHRTADMSSTFESPMEVTHKMDTEFAVISI